MTEKSPTVTCRSVCERLVKYASPRDVFCRAESLPGIIKEARIALGQPDGDADLRNEIRLLRDGAKEMQKHLDAANESRDELRADVRSLTQQLDESKRLASEWQKRAEDAENTIANQNALLARSSTKDVTIELGKMTQRAEEAEAEAVRLRKQRDGTDVELSKAMFLANWLLDRLVERSAV